MLSMSKGVIDQLLLAGLVQTPEASLARFVLLASEPNEVAIQTEVVPDGILERRRRSSSSSSSSRRSLPASHDCSLRSRDTVLK